MGLGQLLHRQSNPHTTGATIDHGRGYDLFGAVFFGGRRSHVYTRLAALSGARPGDRVLDIGCGTGHLTRRLAAVVAPGGSALGIDPSESVLEQARRTTREPSCDYAVGVAESLPAEDDSLDVVANCLMVHHLPPELRPRAAAEMFRVLRPGGRLLIADFRPPANPAGRHLIGALTGPAMEHNPIAALAPLAADAGFTGITDGIVRPWIYYVSATKPGSPA
ncbi:class I SAM-dependent methyltransferase [Nocardia sp. NPDC004068]|uniref:class I SAM-dependent methyltransferase n=1 Tax=Nocardia sp. NPDC004068 TaxID=3364303 RepID=UPI0036899AA0